MKRAAGDLPELPHSTGFPPIAGARATVLILGSLPSAISLARREYYANPRNAFWAIVARLFGGAPGRPYPQRVQALVKGRVALWDVLSAAARSGSADASIVLATAVPNDFGRFFAAHPEIRMIFFNGAKAAELYRRSVLPGLRAGAPEFRYHTLPSTSPAMASLSFAEKLRRWTIVREGTRSFTQIDQARAARRTGRP